MIGENALHAPTRRDTLRMMGIGTWGVLAGGSRRWAGRKTLLSNEGWIDLSLDTYLVVPIRIDGVSQVAIIDSGATRSVIRRDIAHALNLPCRGSARASAVTHTVKGALYEIGHVTIGEFEFDDVQVSSYDLAGMETLASHPLPFVIGQDLLRKLGRVDEFDQA